MITLRLPLSDDASVLGHEVRASKVLAHFGRAGEWSRPPILAILDTGSSVTIVPTDLAARSGVDAVELADAPFIEIEVGLGRRVQGRLAHLDVALVRSHLDLPEVGIVLRSQRIFVVDDAREVMLGQHQVLEHLRFEQRNFDPFYDFEIEERGPGSTAVKDLEPLHTTSR